jgi:hypothetical protein
MAENTPEEAPRGQRTRLWKKPFLATLARTGSVADAARAAGIVRKTVYNLRHKSAAFAKDWDSALETFTDMIEGEALRRAVRGVVRYRFYKGTPILHPELCGCDHGRKSHPHDGRCQEEGCSCTFFLGQPLKELEFSDALLMFLLRGHRPEKYRDFLGLSREEIDALIDERVGELVQARLRELGVKNGEVPHLPASTPVPRAAAEAGATRAAAEPPGAEPGGYDPREFYSDRPPLQPPPRRPRGGAGGHGPPAEG